MSFEVFGVIQRCFRNDCPERYSRTEAASALESRFGDLNGSATNLVFPMRPQQMGTH